MQNWTHKPWCRPSDPINLVFEQIELEEIKNFLLGEGWKLARGYRTLTPDQVIPDPSPTTKRPNDMQLYKPTKGVVLERYHIRLWKFKGDIIASVHMDALRAIGHTASDFESIEKHFAEACKANPKWTVDEDALDLDNRIAGYGQPYNNGKATVVRPR